jgi:hypothetical protein
MTIAKLAYLTSPEVGRYVLNLQPFGAEGVMIIEIGPDQMRNILIDGITLWLRNSLHRVPLTTNSEEANEHTDDRRQRPS